MKTCAGELNFVLPAEIPSALEDETSRGTSSSPGRGGSCWKGVPMDERFEKDGEGGTQREGPHCLTL
jgi:hypothetical protein